MTSSDTSPQILALIPARGGSKSIPRKNLVSVAGKPLIAHSILQALSSKRITRTIVSTDDGEIADVARRFGAEVPFIRPTALAQDSSCDLDVFRHALQWLKEHERFTCDLVVHLRPTGPVRRVALIDEAVDRILCDPEAHSLRSVSWPIQTPYKMWRCSGRYLEPIVRAEGLVESHSAPRQGLPEVWWQNGYVDVIRAETILSLGSMAGANVLPFPTREPILELDYPETIPQIEAALFALELGSQFSVSQEEPRHPV